MRNYDRINVLPPEGIERKRAHIIGGLAGLAAAAFLVDDATTLPQTHRAAAAQLVEERLQ